MKKHEIVTLTFLDDLVEWDTFVDASPQGCVFCRSWWLEAVCPAGFEILTVREGGNIVAGMPLCSEGPKGRRTHDMPPFTQTLGVLFAPTEGKYTHRLTREMRLTQAVIDGLPRHEWFYMQFHHTFTNWLPFHWAGYGQSTRYTYVLPDLSDLDGIYAGFDEARRREIKKAEDSLYVTDHLMAPTFAMWHMKALQKQKKVMKDPLDVFECMHNAACGRECGKAWVARDDQGNVHSAIFMVWDRKAAYYLCGFTDPDFAGSGAHTFLMWEAMRYLSGKAGAWDFEGSMLPGVEEYYRRFGARQVPYFVITKGKKG